MMKLPSKNSKLTDQELDRLTDQDLSREEDALEDQLNAIRLERAQRERKYVDKVLDAHAVLTQLIYKKRYELVEMAGHPPSIVATHDPSECFACRLLKLEDWEFAESTSREGIDLFVTVVVAARGSSCHRYSHDFALPSYSDMPMPEVPTAPATVKTKRRSIK